VPWYPSAQAQKASEAYLSARTSCGITNIARLILILSSMDDALDELDLLLEVAGLMLDESERHACALGGVRQADRNAVCGTVTLCSSAEASW